MLAPSSSMKVTLHIAQAGVYIAARVNSNKHSCGVTAVDLALALYPTSVTFTPIFLNRTSRLHLCFRCIYTTANNKNYQKSPWITRKSLTVSTVRKDYKVKCKPTCDRDQRPVIKIHVCTILRRATQWPCLQLRQARVPANANKMTNSCASSFGANSVA